MKYKRAVTLGVLGGFLGYIFIQVSLIIFLSHKDLSEI